MTNVKIVKIVNNDRITELVKLFLYMSEANKEKIILDPELFYCDKTSAYFLEIKYEDGDRLGPCDECEKEIKYRFISDAECKLEDSGYMCFQCEDIFHPVCRDKHECTFKWNSKNITLCHICYENGMSSCTDCIERIGWDDEYIRDGYKAFHVNH